MNNARISRQLKESLSVALTKFYPFAGKLNGCSSVICNDSTGALYIEAEVDSTLSDAIQYSQYFQHLGKSSVPLSVQLTFFCCGGTAIGIHYSHWIADAWTFAIFLNYWARISFGAHIQRVLEPKFGLGYDIFPPLHRGINPFTVYENTLSKKKMTSKRFLFKNEKIASLKKLASTGNFSAQNPTKVEVVSGFIWKEIIQMHKSKTNPNNELVARFAMNLRKKIGRPQVDDFAMGNFIISTPVSSTLETETDLGFLVGEFRKAAHVLTTMDLEFDCVKYCNESFEAAKKPGVWSCMFSSMCGIPLYEVDFGWGKPLLITPTAITKPLVLLGDNKNGIEAFINLSLDEMQMISNEFLSLETQTDSVVISTTYSRL